MTTPTHVTPDEASAQAYITGAEQNATRVPDLDGVTPRPITRTGIIGGGTMGVGIAVAFAEADLPVHIVERDAVSASAARERVVAVYTRHLKRAMLSDEARAARMGLVSVTDDWGVLRDCQLVIEAAFEHMAVKVAIFRRLETLAPPGAILATNTSYLDIDAIAAATSRPRDVVGLHFFAPANLMRLLEVVRAQHTAPDVLATALALAVTLEKQPVVAGVCDGFIGNRIFAVYRRHAEYLVEDGASPDAVDAALEAYGFAMGPFAVSDLSGLDIAYAMRRRRDATRAAGERYVPVADRLHDAGRLGRKAGAGWYAYDAAGKRAIDPVTTAIVEDARVSKGITPRSFTNDEIQRRALAVLANEGAKVLAEGIARCASDIDVALVNGYGFPRRKGGPMWAADRQGLTAVLAEVERAHLTGGTGSEPAPLLVELAGTHSTFGAWRRE